jgi:3'-phosphoadenosine 5'-phosphosulfate sulfotransferase (PAPS reductase)/FAD synthetase
MTRPYIVFCSGGNDSVALVQFCRDAGLANVTIVYSDTGWAADSWASRLHDFKAWVIGECGYGWQSTHSIGMPALVQQKKGWPMPRAGSQFCTLFLKILPALELLAQLDPEKRAICVVGIRREESENRKYFPEWTASSNKHDGRTLWAPLVMYTEIHRNALLSKTPFQPLPHRSQECSPCIYANRADLRAVEEPRISQIERLEAKMGYTSKGKPRFMFRPYRFMGARGIREVIRWAFSSPGKYKVPPANTQCDSGYCGD